MPSVSRMSEEALSKLEQAGSSSTFWRTGSRYLYLYLNFLYLYMYLYLQEDLEDVQKVVKTEEGRLPKRSTAQALRSRLKSDLINRYNFDIANNWCMYLYFYLYFC